MKNNILYVMIFLVSCINFIHAGEQEKENLQKRISLLQQELAKKIASEPEERDYGIKITNESGIPLMVSASVGNPQKFNPIFKLTPLYNKQSLDGSSAPVILKQKWPLKIQIMSNQQHPLFVLDNRKQRASEFSLDLNEAKNYEVSNGIGKSYHFYIRKPLKHDYFEILTPAEYERSIKTEKRWSYENKPRW